jgi:hypothetical protein
MEIALTLILAFVVPPLIELAMKRGRLLWLESWFREAWMLIFCFLTVYMLYQPNVTTTLHRYLRLQGIFGYVVWMVVGAAIFGGYWKFTERFAQPNNPEPVHSYVKIVKLELHLRNGRPEPPFVLAHYRNSGVITTQQESLFGSVFCRALLPDDDASADILFAEFTKSFKYDATTQWRQRLDPGDGLQDRYYSKELDGIDPNDALQGHKFIFFVGGILHSDATGHYRRAVCYVWFPPTFRGRYAPKSQDTLMENWYSCIPSKAKAWEDEARNDKY